MEPKKPLKIEIVASIHPELETRPQAGRRSRNNSYLIWSVYLICT
jgi:hypothetical protein